MELNALVSGDGFKKLSSSFVIFVTAIFLSSFFYSKQLYKTSFYLLAIMGFCIAITRSFGLLKNNFAFPWKSFLILSGICVIWFLYLSLVVGANTGIANSGAGFTLYFILFFFLFFLEEKQEQLLYFAFIVVPVSALLSAQLNGMTLSSYEDLGSKFSKYLLIASLVPLYRYVEIKHSQIIMLVGLASIFLGAMALIDFWNFDSLKMWFFDELKDWGGRAAGNSTPARFGTVGACLLCICIAFLFQRREHILFQRIVLTVAVGCSLLSVLLSETRGVWVAVLCFVVFMLFIAPGYSKRMKFSIFAVFAIMVTVILQLGFVKDRMQLVVEHYDSYMQAEDYAAIEKQTAVGLRLELWRASYEMFLKSPIFGIGGGNFKYELKSIVETGYYHPATLKYHSSHNQFLAALSGRGLLGFLATILFFVICFMRFSRLAYKAKNSAVQSCAFGGMAVAVIYAVSGLTHETLDQKYLLMFFMISISMFYSAARVKFNAELLSRK